VVFFAAGSAICGASQSINMLIAGRAIQGVGSSGIGVLCEIIVRRHLTPLPASEMLAILIFCFVLDC
jgi:MFS family permease